MLKRNERKVWRGLFYVVIDLAFYVMKVQPPMKLYSKIPDAFRLTSYVTHHHAVCSLPGLARIS
eukprot:scaffold3081_cov112-Skeletonema_dohrnii-CCMP3373.AAC.5